MALVSACLLLTACSTSFTGPVTKRKYEVDVGCTDDMPRYREAREKAMDEKIDDGATRDPELECPPIDPPAPEIP